MKTLLCSFLSVLAVTSLAACEGGSGGGSTTTTTPVATATPFGQTPTPTPTPTPVPVCTDGNATNQNAALPCACGTGYTVSSDGTTCTATTTSATYQRSYNAYTPAQSSTNACSGTVSTTRTSVCKRTSDNVTVADSFCSADPTPTSTVQSKSGTVTTSHTNSSLANGYEQMTCAVGATSGTHQVVCNTAYHVEGSTLATQNCYSNTRTCSPLPSGTLAGTQTWSTSSSTYSTCAATSCDSTANYGLSGTTCVVCPTGQVSINGTCQYGEAAQSLIMHGQAVFQTKSSGDLISWGRGANGQLGTNTTSNQLSPSIISLGTSLTSKKVVSIGYLGGTTCSILSDNSVKCWGYNGSGLVGVNSSTNTFATPQTVSLGQGVKDLVDSYSSVCAILMDNSLKCWGANNYGGIGNGTQTNQTQPVAVDVGTGLTVKRLVMTKFSETTACAILSDDSVKCWGFNTNGQVGGGFTSSAVTSPRTVALGQGAKNIYFLENGDSTTNFTVCALLLDSSLKCWGDNTNGKLGSNSANANESLPQSVSFGTGRSVLDVVNNILYAACAVLDDGTVKCWGKNNASQLGILNTADQKVPVSVTFPGSKSVSKVVISTVDSSCAIHTDGSLSCWGSTYRGVSAESAGTTPTAISLGGKLVKDIIPQKLNTGGYDTCLLTTDGTVMCTGDNIKGTIGNGGSYGFVTTFTSVPTSTTVKTAVQEGYSVCATLTTGSVQCWGAGETGQMGNGSTSNVLSPTSVNYAY